MILIRYTGMRWKIRWLIMVNFKNTRNETWTIYNMYKMNHLKFTERGKTFVWGRINLLEFKWKHLQFVLEVDPPAIAGGSTSKTSHFWSRYCTAAPLVRRLLLVPLSLPIYMAPSLSWMSRTTSGWASNRMIRWFDGARPSSSSGERSCRNLTFFLSSAGQRLSRALAINHH